jgi:hypothetical protein
MKKRFVIGALVLGTVFTTVFGFAATLGVSGSELGAGNAAVASCDTDGVSTSYDNAWDAADKRYEVTTVTITGIANTCDGKTLKVALTDGSNVLLGSGSVTIPTDTETSATVSPLSANPAASAVLNVHVVIG